MLKGAFIAFGIMLVSIPIPIVAFSSLSPSARSSAASLAEG